MTRYEERIEQAISGRTGGQIRPALVLMYGRRVVGRCAPTDLAITWGEVADTLRGAIDVYRAGPDGEPREFIARYPRFRKDG